MSHVQFELDFNIQIAYVCGNQSEGKAASNVRWQRSLKPQNINANAFLMPIGREVARHEDE